MTKTRTGVKRIGRSFLPDPENTSMQESERQVLALCVAGLLSQIALCASNTGDINHPDQDLMVSAAAWVLLKSKSELKSPTTAIPPDYRGPSLEQGENGARFWRLETLGKAVRQGQECTSEN